MNPLSVGLPVVRKRARRPSGRPTDRDLNCPGLPEAIWFKSRRHVRFAEHGLVSFLGFGWWDIADGLRQPAIVEPVDPGQCSELDSLEASPRSAPMNDLCLVEPIDRLGESVVITVADAADGRLDAGLGQSLDVANADVLRPAIRMVHQTELANWPPFMQSLLESVEDETGMCCSAHSPADDLAGVGIDDEGHIDEAGPSADVG